MFLLLLLLFTSIILIQGSSDEDVGSHDDSNFSNLKSQVRINLDQNKKDAWEDDAARVHRHSDRVLRDVGDRVHRDVGDRVHRDANACKFDVRRCRKDRILRHGCEGRKPRCCYSARCPEVKALCDNPFEGLTLSVQFKGKQLPCECVKSVCEEEIRNEYRKPENEKRKTFHLTGGHCCGGEDSDFNQACPAEMKSVAPKCRMVLIGWLWIPCQKTGYHCVEQLKEWREKVEANQGAKNPHVLEEHYKSQVKLWESQCCQSSSVFYSHCPTEMAEFGKRSPNPCH